MKLEFSGQFFEKCTKIKFHENPFSGSRVVPCGQTDIKKLIVAFRTFSTSPKKGEISHQYGTYAINDKY